MKSWVDTAANQLADSSAWTYAAAPVAATEPTALAALALLFHGEASAALRPLEWLVRHQNRDGSLGVTADQESPGWATSLALLAWSAAGKILATNVYADCCQRGIGWLLSTTGTTPVRAPHVGHDTTILGWPWVAGTHAWIEPTAFALLALRAQELGNHPRAVSAHAMLVDRLLPHGGSNYGNTVVLGQELLPHVQPTGIAMLAIERSTDDPRLALSIEYLEQFLPRTNTAGSLSFGLLGLWTHSNHVTHAEARLAKCFAETIKRGANAYALALLVLAAHGEERPFEMLTSSLVSITS